MKVVSRCMRFPLCHVRGSTRLATLLWFQVQQKKCQITLLRQNSMESQLRETRTSIFTLERQIAELLRENSGKHYGKIAFNMVPTYSRGTDECDRLRGVSGNRPWQKQTRFVHPCSSGSKRKTLKSMKVTWPRSAQTARPLSCVVCNQ